MKARFAITLIVLPVIAWALFGLLGGHVSLAAAARYGTRLVAHGDGKFTDARTFINGRLKECVVLLTAACLLILIHRALAGLASRRLQPPFRWVVQGWSAFVCLNVFAAIAGGTVLFWTLLFTGKNHTHNYTQYRIKENLMREIRAPRQAVLLGASQTRAEIDTKVLNDRLGEKLWTTELHFPGSSMYDRILCLERLPSVRLDYVVTYVSEDDFFGGFDNGRLIYFFGFRDLPGYWNLGAGKPALDSYMVCGLLGDIFPLYRMWDPLVARARFWPTEDEAQAHYDATLESDLSERARRAARGMGRGEGTEFSKRQFVAFASLCRERHARLVVCCGHLNPIYERALNTALRPEMIAFLHEQAGKDSNIVLLEDPQMPQQGEADYEDLTHVTPAARAIFSTYIADTLEKLDDEKPR